MRGSQHNSWKLLFLDFMIYCVISLETRQYEAIDPSGSPQKKRKEMKNKIRKRLDKGCQCCFLGSILDCGRHPITNIHTKWVSKDEKMSARGCMVSIGKLDWVIEFILPSANREKITTSTSAREPQMLSDVSTDSSKTQAFFLPCLPVTFLNIDWLWPIHLNFDYPINLKKTKWTTYLIASELGVSLIWSKS